MTDYYLDIAPHLDRIMRDAAMAESCAKWIEQHVKNLPAKPQWNTKAEDEINICETKLWHALQLVRRAKQAYARLPVEHV